MVSAVESEITGRAEAVTGALDTAQSDVDAAIQALFDEDQMNANPTWGSIDEAKSFLEVEFNQALDELT